VIQKATTIFKKSASLINKTIQTGSAPNAEALTAFPFGSIFWTEQKVSGGKVLIFTNF